MKKLFITCSLILIYSLSFAQSSSHDQAINELVDAMHLKEQISESADRMLEIQAESVPQMAQYKDVMSDFFHKYINWETIGDKVKNVYKETFSEQEIRDLIAFYKTDTGQKLANATPDLTTKMAKISQKIVLKHQSELQQKIMDSMQN